MRFLRQAAFYMGMATGTAALAAVGAVFLTYLFTGKFASVTVNRGKASMTLLTPSEIVAQVREQVTRTRTAEEAEGHGKA